MALKLRSARPRILLLIDSHAWAFAAIARGIEEELCDTYAFTIATAEELPALDLSTFDLVHVFWFMEQAYRTRLPAETPVIKGVYSERWREAGMNPATLYSTYLRDAAAIVVPNRDLERELGHLPVPVRLFPEGVDTRLFVSGLPRVGPLVAGWAGRRDDPIKQLPLCEEACAGLCELKIAGGDVLPEAMPDFYRHIDVLLISSRAEGCPRPLLEAMACGVFPVAFPVGIAPELIEHERNGLLVEDRTARGLRRALAWCQTHPEVLRSAATVNRSLVEQQRTWAATVPTIAAVYREVLQQTETRPAIAPVAVIAPRLALRPRVGSALYRLWCGCGQPFPRLARFLRYGMFKRLWLARAADIAVVITSHNYGRYLDEAIASVLHQTILPREIVVIDDASDDNTEAVTRRYAEKGVHYLRIDERNVSHARNHGADATEASFLLFLDADDALQPTYIERCLALMDDPRVAIAYGDRQHVGEENRFIDSGPYDYERLSRGNFIASCSLLRRQAFDLVGGFRDLPGGFEDWDLFRRILRTFYIAKHAPTSFLYRIHAQSRNRKQITNTEWTYAAEAGILRHPLTIFTPFAGRAEVLDAYLEGLRSLHVDPAQIHLHWYNTSDDPRFDERLRRESARLPFGSVTYTHAPSPPFWGHTPASLIRNRITESEQTEYYYQLAVVRAYNAMLQTCTTDYVLTLEDDMRLSPDTLQMLAAAMGAHVAAVVAPYESGFYPRYEVWMQDETGNLRHFRERGKGIQNVGGSGFGCTLFRTDALRSVAPLRTEVRCVPKRWYDQIAYTDLKRSGRILCQWDARVQHLATERYAQELPDTFS